MGILNIASGQRYVTRLGQKDALNIVCDQDRIKGYLRDPCRYYMVVFRTVHQFLGIIVSIISSYLELDTIFQVPL